MPGKKTALTFFARCKPLLFSLSLSLSLSSHMRTRHTKIRKGSRGGRRVAEKDDEEGVKGLSYVNPRTHKPTQSSHPPTPPPPPPSLQKPFRHFCHGFLHPPPYLTFTPPTPTLLSPPLSFLLHTSPLPPPSFHPPSQSVLYFPEGGRNAYPMQMLVFTHKILVEM